MLSLHVYMFDILINRISLSYSSLQNRIHEMFTCFYTVLKIVDNKILRNTINSLW